MAAAPKRTRNRILFGAIALLGVLALAWFIILPPLARSAVRNALAAAGFQPASFELDSLGFNRMHLRNLQVGSPVYVTAASVDLAYSPLGLISGDVRSIDIDHLQWRAAVRDGAIDWGYAPPPSSSGEFTLPAERITLTDSSLVLAATDGDVTLPVTAVASRNPSGGTDVQATISGWDRTATLAGSYADDGSAVNAQIIGDVFVQSNSTSTAPAAQAPASSSSGQPRHRFKAAYARAADGTSQVSTTMQTSGDDLPLGDAFLTFGNAMITGTFAFDAAGNLSDVNASGVLDRAAFDDVSIKDLQWTAVLNPQGNVTIEASVAGDSWKATSLHGMIYARQRVENPPGTRVIAWLAHMVDAPLPDPLRAALADAGIQISPEPRLQLAGNGNIVFGPPAANSSWTDRLLYQVINEHVSADPAAALITLPSGLRAMTELNLVKLSGSISATGVLAHVSPGRVLAMPSIHAASASAIGTAESPALALMLEGGGADLFVPFESEQAWSMNAPRILLQARGANVSATDVRGTLNGSLPLTLLAGEESIRVRMAEHAVFNLNGVTIGPAASASPAAPVRINIQPRHGEDFFTWRAGAETGSLAKFACGIQAFAPGSTLLNPAPVAASFESITGGATIAFDAAGAHLENGDLSVQHAAFNLGPLRVADANLAVRAPNASAAQVTDCNATFGDGGLVAFQPFDIDLSARRARTTMTASNLSLEGWLALLAGDYASGEGRVSGNADLEFNFGQGDWTPIVHAASLRATPDHGYLQITDTAAVEDYLADQDPTVRDRAVAALQDFEFNRLSVEITRPGDMSVARIAFSGSGRTGDRQGVNLNLEYHNVGRLLQDALAESILGSRAAEDALNSFFNGRN